ncbi:nudix hydrolase [Moumouvirus maliensis]|nr:nudix hydrolase [Moumouvirus maliensis]
MICGAALMDYNNYLCIVKEKQSGLWGLPKGRKASSEDITTYACTCRKIRQELLLDVESEEFDCDWIRGIKSGRHCIFIMKTNLVFTKIDTRICKNLSEINWVPLNYIFDDSFANPGKYNKSIHILRNLYFQNDNTFIQVNLKNLTDCGKFDVDKKIEN